MLPSPSSFGLPSSTHLQYEAHMLLPLQDLDFGAASYLSVQAHFSNRLGGVAKVSQIVKG